MEMDGGELAVSNGEWGAEGCWLDGWSAAVGRGKRAADGRTAEGGGLVVSAGKWGHGGRLRGCLVGWFGDGKAGLVAGWLFGW